MCVHSTVMRQKNGADERLIVHLFSDLNTTAFHALPNDDVPLREEVVPIHDIRVTFATGLSFRRDSPRAGGEGPGGRVKPPTGERGRAAAGCALDGRGRA